MPVSMILHSSKGLFLFAFGKPDLDANMAFFGKLYRIADEVDQDLP